jgi:DNA-binding transcriptional LysR family regulator
MDRLQAMRVFEQVVAENGFAAAARKLDLPPSTVTRLVKDLEDHLRVQLLLRSTRRLALTPAGEAYLERVRTILGALDAAEEAVSEHATEMSGSVRVLALPGLSTHLVAPAAAAFRRLHPRVTIDLRSDLQPTQGLEGYDVALLTDEIAPPAEAVVRPLTKSRWILCASPHYLARRGEPREPQDLRGHEWIRLALPPVAPGPLKLMRDVGPARDGTIEQSIEIDAALSCNDHEAVLRGTLEGAGFSAQTLEVAAPLIRSGRLQQVLPGWNAGCFTMIALFATRRHMPARVRAFLDHLLQAATQAEAALVVGPSAAPVPAVPALARSLGMGLLPAREPAGLWPAPACH